MLPSQTSVLLILRRHLAILRSLIARSSIQESLVKVLETRMALKASLELVSRRSMPMLMSRPELRAGLPLRPQAMKVSVWSGTCRISKSRSTLRKSRHRNYCPVLTLHQRSKRERRTRGSTNLMRTTLSISSLKMTKWTRLRPSENTSQGQSRSFSKKEKSTA